MLHRPRLVPQAFGAQMSELDAALLGVLSVVIPSAVALLICWGVSKGFSYVSRWIRTWRTM